MEFNGYHMQDHIEIAMEKLRELVRSDDEKIACEAAYRLASICLMVVNSFEDDSEDIE